MYGIDHETSLLVYALALFLSWQFFLPATPYAAPSEEEILRQIGVDEKLGHKVPLDLLFSDSESWKVTLGKFFCGGPVILTPDGRVVRYL